MFGRCFSEAGLTVMQIIRSADSFYGKNPDRNKQRKGSTERKKTTEFSRRDRNISTVCQKNMDPVFVS